MELHKGLGCGRRRVGEAANSSESFKVPHMGWNNIEIKPGSQLFAGIPQGSWFYLFIPTTPFLRMIPSWLLLRITASSLSVAVEKGQSGGDPVLILKKSSDMVNRY